MWYLKHHTPLSLEQELLLNNYGCLPRLLEFTNHALKNHIDQIHTSLKNLANNEWSTDRISHSCLFLFNDGEVLDKDEFYYYTRRITKIGTKNMLSLVVKYRIESQRSWYSSISNSDIPPRVVGSIFEAGVIDTINKYPCSLAVHSLDKENSDYEVISSIPTASNFFDKIEDIVIGKSFGLFVPNDPNFKALDAIWISADRIDVFQMTISKSHDIVNGFSSSLKHLKQFPLVSKSNKIRFFFMIENI